MLRCTTRKQHNYGLGAVFSVKSGVLRIGTNVETGTPENLAKTAPDRVSALVRLQHHHHKPGP